MFEKRSSSFWQAAKALIIFCHAVVFLLTAASWSSAGKQEAYEHLTAVMDQQQSSSDLRFLKSYVTLAVTSPDRYLQNVAFIYDNALALLAFLARGSEDDLRRAKVLADAFVYAMGHDRSYSDHRLRNAYNSDDLIDDATGAAKLPGWWDTNARQWYEDEVQVSSYTGNLAWVIIALTASYEKMGGTGYLTAAQELGEWIQQNTASSVCDGGYSAGYQGWEPSPTRLNWKSTEHNIDVYVAFMRLYRVTGVAKWQDRALHARQFVESMWDAGGNHFWTGTDTDGCTINRSNIPLDNQTWAIMAFNDYKSAITWAEANCYTEADGFLGFDFNTDRDGVWFEGTAQMVLAYQLNNQLDKADVFTGELRKCQLYAANNNQQGIVAASHDGVSTGFEWQYFSRLHIGATSWYIFAEAGWDPYWGTATKSPCCGRCLAAGDLSGDHKEDLVGIVTGGAIYATFDMNNWRRVPGVLRQLTCGDFNGDGKADLAGTTAAGQIYLSYDLANWQLVPGALQQTAACDFDGNGVDELAGVTGDGLIFYTADLVNWQWVPGRLAQITCADFDGNGRDDLAGVTAAQQIYYSYSLGQWRQLPGALQQITAGDFDGDGKAEIIGVTSAGSIYYSPNLADWQQVPGNLACVTAVGAKTGGLCGLAGYTEAGLIFYTPDLLNWLWLPGKL